MSNFSYESFPMNHGEGALSYVKNSSHQKGRLMDSKTMIEEMIALKLDIQPGASSNRVNIADLGCSTGPNTFVVVQTVVEAIKLKYLQTPTLSSHKPEFQVYFNDHVSNDFNTLFNSIPPNKEYFAAGAPGSFYGRLFPKSSLNFVHSSFALQWLSLVPSELLDRDSAAWNKGRILYANAPQEVFEAYSAQFEKDMSSFLNARGEEIVPGGLMALLLIASPDDVLSPETTFIQLYDLMGSCLMDVAKLGMLMEDEIDSFKLPVYNTSPKEMKALIERNGCFSIEKMEILHHAIPDAKTCFLHLRAAMEGVFKEHFKSEIMDELFQRLTKKIDDSCVLSENSVTPNELFVVLKCKTIQ